MGMMNKNKEKWKRQYSREKEERDKIKEAFNNLQERLSTKVKHGNISDGKDNLIDMFPDMKDRINKPEKIIQKTKHPFSMVKLTW